MFDPSFKQACLKLGLESKIDLFEKYINIILYWNQQLNLVGRQQTVERIHHHHLLDSLILTPLLKEFTEVCDVGSGAGFPALCWAIARDDFQVTLVEKSPKKASFLTCSVE
jgi:16S rRNA (guanine527-N7)-methyltransferase